MNLDQRKVGPREVVADAEKGLTGEPRDGVGKAVKVYLIGVHQGAHLAAGPAERVGQP